MLRWRVELHCHTNASPCATISPEQLVSLARRAGLGALAVTDHDTLEGAYQVRDLADFTVIIGEEVSSKDGEIIGFFLNEVVPPGLTAEETIRKIRDQGGIVCIPHPFDWLRRKRVKKDKLLELVPEIDCLEVWNARNVFKSANQRALEFAQEHNLLSLAGSDAHTRFEVARSGMYMEPFSGPQEFLNSLRSAEAINKKTPIWVHGITKLRKIWIK